MGAGDAWLWPCPQKQNKASTSTGKPRTPPDLLVDFNCKESQNCCSRALKYAAQKGTKQSLSFPSPLAILCVCVCFAVSVLCLELGWQAEAKQEDKFLRQNTSCIGLLACICWQVFLSGAGDCTDYCSSYMSFSKEL